VDGGALSVIPYFHYLATSLAGSLFQLLRISNLSYVGDEMLYWELNAYHLIRKGSHQVKYATKHTQEPDDIKRKEQNSHQ
jgi:hypothetical protein